MTTQQVTKPFDDLMSILPNIRDCDTNSNNCTCVDPSYNYGQKCTPHGIGNDKRTKNCTFGKTGNNQRENSVGGVKEEDADKYSYTVGTTTGRASFNQKDTNLGSQPPSLLFCSNPTGTGGTALPTKTKSQITPGTNGTIDSGEWKTSSVGNDTTQTNLGFDT